MRLLCSFVFFFFNDTATTEIYTLSLHDALPILFSCLQILEAFLWFVLITLLNVTLIILKGNKNERSEERFSRNAESDVVCRRLLGTRKAIMDGSNVLIESRLFFSSAS